MRVRRRLPGRAAAGNPSEVYAYGMRAVIALFR